jgi:hypothetical protein
VGGAGRVWWWCGRWGVQVTSDACIRNVRLRSVAYVLHMYLPCERNRSLDWSSLLLHAGTLEASMCLCILLELSTWSVPLWLWMRSEAGQVWWFTGQSFHEGVVY